jgi:hypothetical protein
LNAQLFSSKEELLRALKTMATVAASLAMVAAGAAPAVATTWKMEKMDQVMCVDPDFGHPGAYFIGSVVGKWSGTITTGLSNLPPNAVFKGSSVLPPGSHVNPPGSAIINVFAGVAIGPAPAGEYHSELWATDGKHTESTPIRITFREGC